MGIVVDVLVNGRAVEKYRHEGKTFIEGRRGSEYALRIRNTSGTKIKAVIFVDNKNVMTGDSNKTTGYLVESWGSIDIPGWRIDRDKVSSFEFADLRGGYQGDADLVGVIGVRAYEEKQLRYTFEPLRYADHNPRWLNYPLRQLCMFGENSSDPRGIAPTWNSTSSWGGASGQSINMAASACTKGSLFSDASAQTMGSGAEDVGLSTGWGAEQSFKTKSYYGDFELTHSYESVIYYDTRKGLEARGVRVSRARPLPDAFPNDFGCPPPSTVRRG